MKSDLFCRLRRGDQSSTRRSPAVIFFLLWLTAGALTGCALSPQTVTLSPLIDVGMPAIGHGRTLSLRVSDQRPQQAFGSRGGIYNGTALITPRNDVAQTLQRALAERLRAAGFRVVGSEETTPLGLAVQIQRIDYRVTQAQGLNGVLVNNAKVTAQLQATVHSGNRSSSGQYRASSVRQVLGYPSAAANDSMINDAVTEALRQLLQDPDLLALLRQ